MASQSPARPPRQRKRARASSEPLSGEEDLVKPLSKHQRSVSAGSTSQRLSLPPLRPPLDKREQALFVTGNGSMGNFGLGVEDLSEKRFFERHRSGLGEIAAIVCGELHTLALDEQGRVWSWGINDSGALGRSTAPTEGADIEELESTPALVEGLTERVVRIAAGGGMSLAVLEKSGVRVWGLFRSHDGPLASFTRPTALPELSRVAIAQIACGSDHVLVLSNKGEVYVFGNGQQGQLGRKVIERRKSAGLKPEKLALRNIVHIGAGSFSSFAVDSFGRCYGWGLNETHQTGLAAADGGDATVIHNPTRTAALEPSRLGGAKVVSVKGGNQHTLFLLDDGRIMACGRTDEGACGVPADHPLRLESRQVIEEQQLQRNEVFQAERARLVKLGRSIEEAEEEALAAATEQIFMPFESIPEPVFLDSLPPISVIQAGARSSYAVAQEDGQLYVWGSGQALGLGVHLQNTPAPAPLPSRWRVVGIRVSTEVALVVTRLNV